MKNWFKNVAINIGIVYCTAFLIILTSDTSVSLGYKLITLLAVIVIVAFVTSDEFKGKKK